MSEQHRLSPHDEVGALYLRWRRLLGDLGVLAPTGDTVFADLIQAYSREALFYHNLRHLCQVLDAIERFGERLKNRAAVRLAAWFHDAVYDPRAGDNEERSAALAADRLSSLGIDAATVEEVQRLILLTRDHRTEPNDQDGRWLLDADLAILGAEEREYRAYAAAIRQEYAWVPEDDYRQGRSAVLGRFLARERIYHTNEMAQELEAAARRNLEAELRILSTVPPTEKESTYP